jgi:hypothetical protein
VAPQPACAKALHFHSMALPRGPWPPAMDQSLPGWDRPAQGVHR